MAEFIIATSDGTYSWNADDGDENNTVNIRFDPENNNAFADTQGFMRKKQEGYSRAKAKVKVALSRTEYEDIFAPMLVYPDYCEVTFDRNIPLRGTATGDFVFESMKVVQELAGPVYEVELVLTEII